jgi:hypothetical protein
MARMKHSGGIVETVLELGFDTVKYFEATITETASGFSISPPARRLIVNNRSTTNNVYLRIDGQDASTTVGFTPGDNIKISPEGSFAMDFDALTAISFITEASTTANIEGLLGFKGIVG